MDVLRALATPNLDIRQKTLDLALDLITHRNIDEVNLLPVQCIAADYQINMFDAGPSAGSLHPPQHRRGGHSCIRVPRHAVWFVFWCLAQSEEDDMHLTSQLQHAYGAICSSKSITELPRCEHSHDWSLCCPIHRWCRR